ncbi:MAG: FAD-dependent oxidoreductase [Phycisphaerae bacterium]
MTTIDKYDVIVAGGGPGGVGAAVAASRGGARTLLVEREGCLGGGGTTMLVNPFMPYTTDCWREKGDEKIVNAGIFMEALKELKARGGTSPDDDRRFDDEAWKVVLDDLVASAGVTVIFHAALYDAQSASGRVQSIRLAHNSGPITVTGKVFIDATGDALLSAMAGCEVMFGNEDGKVMPMTLNFIVGGVDNARAPSGEQMRKLAAKGDKDTPALINTNFSCLSYFRPGTMHFNAIRIIGNTIDPTDLSNAESEGRRRVQNFVAWLKANVPGYEKCYLVKTGQHIGIRESRRVVGDYMLTGEDFSRCAKFDDGIACSAYPVDIHGQKQGQTRIEHLPPGEYYHIPYRCLTPKGMANLLVASRSVSADVVAHSSLRVMPIVMNIGEAAGYAAAMSLPAGDVRKIDVQKLRAKIRAAGGVLEAKPKEAAVAK